jgi:hypothetical protein
VFETLFQVRNFLLAHKIVPVSSETHADLLCWSFLSPTYLSFKSLRASKAALRRAAVNAHCARHFPPVMFSARCRPRVSGRPEATNPARFRDDATANEIRAEVMRRIAELADAGVLDLEAPVALSTSVN